MDKWERRVDTVLYAFFKYSQGQSTHLSCDLCHASPEANLVLLLYVNSLMTRITKHQSFGLYPANSLVQSLVMFDSAHVWIDKDIFLKNPLWTIGVVDLCIMRLAWNQESFSIQSMSHSDSHSWMFEHGKFNSGIQTSWEDAVQNHSATGSAVYLLTAPAQLGFPQCTVCIYFSMFLAISQFWIYCKTNPYVHS